MIQLKVYDSPERLEQYWIDLYDTEPIKLTLSIEDITNADATSTYSKVFKVPGTRKNAEFFKNAFEIDGTLFDVTIKKPAEILVDGAEFKQGQIRLQKIFRNTDLDRIDYELLFLGETRDFSGTIGDKALCELIMPDLVGDATGVALTAAAVQQSWLAYPESASLTAGLHSGNIIYPLIDHGNTYDSDGVAQETRIDLNHGGPNGNFTTNNHPLSIDRLKPMIRAKRIWDQIFADAGYTYTSDFLNSDLFHQMYVSAFGNIATIYATTPGSGANSNNVAYGNNLVSGQSIYDRLSFPNNWVDGGNNLSNPPSSPYGTVYTTPVTGPYTIEAQAWYQAYVENSNYSQTPVPNQLELYDYTDGAVLDFSPLAPGTGTTVQVSFSGTIPSGHVLGLRFATTNADVDLVTNVEFEVLEAPGVYNPTTGLECTYKQIDFIKDMLTAFRLVLAPDPKKPLNFIVEPWQTYINSGNLHDWSHKLVENKDFVSEPVFFSQSDIIDFKFQPGSDYANIYHQQAYQEPYGWLQFNSGNDLLKGTREIKLTGIAPSILSPIEGSDATDNIPLLQLHTHSSEDVGLEHLPIKAKTRFLFYNGLQPFVDAPHDRWYLGVPGNTTLLNQYPLVSPYQEWPIQPQTLNLNWANDIKYWTPFTGGQLNGSTLYSDFWSRYISSLYNKYSRRVTAHFVLNNIDLNEFSFDDTIFVNGTYYSPEKIIDLEVGDYTEVQVQLLTANDYRPTFIQDETLTGVVLEPFNDTCGEGLGYINVTTNGTPGFTWALNNGTTGSALVGTPAGNAPYFFTIPNVPPGLWTVTLTDSLGRDYAADVTVPTGLGSAPTATYTVTPASDCFTCDGSVDVTPTGGVAPYTVNWLDGPSGSTGVKVYTNVPESGNQFHQAFRTTAYDPAYNPPYDFQYNEFAPWFWIDDTYDYSLRRSPLVINEINSTTQPWFDLPGRQVKIPVGVAGTFNFKIDLELTNIQGIDLSGDTFRWQVVVNGGTNTSVIIPTLPIDGTPVPFSETFTYTSDGTQAIDIRILFRQDDGGPTNPPGPIIGYRGTYEVYTGNGPLRNDLCPNTSYSFYVTDSTGCSSQVYTVEVPCDITGNVYIARKHSTECNQLGLVDYIVQSPSVISPIDVFTINGLEGCYSIISTTTQTPQYTPNQFFVDCPTCQGIPVGNNWQVRNCGNLETVVVDFDGITPSIGQVFELSGPTGCWEVIAESDDTPVTTVLTGPYIDCAECQGTPPPTNCYYYDAYNNVDPIELCNEVLTRPIYANTNDFYNTATILYSGVAGDCSTIATPGRYYSIDLQQYRYWDGVTLGPPTILICP